MRHADHRATVLCLAMAALLGATVLGAGCGDDPTIPEAEAEVTIRPDSFFPDSLTINTGERVVWVNRMNGISGNIRTVTSGTGPADSTAGVLFDETLEGFKEGEPFGDTFVYQFHDPGTYPYFTRRPPGGEYSGVVVVE
jgi:plastocyanin